MTDDREPLQDPIRASQGPEPPLELGLPRGVPEARAALPAPPPAASLRLRDELSLYLPPRG